MVLACHLNFTLTDDTLKELGTSPFPLRPLLALRTMLHYRPQIISPTRAQKLFPLLLPLVGDEPELDTHATELLLEILEFKGQYLTQENILDLMSVVEGYFETLHISTLQSRFTKRVKAQIFSGLIKNYCHFLVPCWNTMAELTVKCLIPKTFFECGYIGMQ